MEIELKLGGVGVEVKIEGVRGLLTALGIAAVAAAVIQELRAPPGERDWRGRLAGVVPYDLRPPTWARLRGAMWAPESPELLVPTAFGVGWTVNVAALGERLGLRGPIDGTSLDAEPEPAH
jgi:hypothetical protein